MAANWDEIKRLAADFQKAQLSSTLQRLSERNCVEIIQWLTKHQMIDLIYTIDGKEYLTPQHLCTEIVNELIIQGGRINLTQLSKNLNVDLVHIKKSVTEVIRNNKNIHLVQWILINDDCITEMAVEINEKLSQQGQISINNLTVQYDLPSDFLRNQVIEKYLGIIIRGRRDPSDTNVYFTEEYISRSKAIIKGALLALLKPTPVSVITNYIHIPEKMFFSLFDDVIKFGTLSNKSSGAQYIPNIYSKSQNMFVLDFYHQNGYLDFDAIKRVGIADYRSFIKQQFPDDTFYMLDSCVISKRLMDQVEAALEECISSEMFLDIQSNFPSTFNDTDVQIAIEKFLTPNIKKELILMESYIISSGYINAVSKACTGIMNENAKNIVKSGRYHQYQVDLKAMNTHKVVAHEEPVVVEDTRNGKREERRRKATSGRAGGGAQGRETKTKSTKRNVRPNRQQKDDDDDDYDTPKKSIPTLEIISLKEITEAINSQLVKDGIGELADELAQYIYQTLNTKGMEIAESLFTVTLSDLQANRKKTHAFAQDELNFMINNIRLYDKGLKLLPTSAQPVFEKYLMKTVCIDVVNEILCYLVSEQGTIITRDSLNPQLKTKLIASLPPESKPVVQKLMKLLAEGKPEDFLTIVKDSLPICGMIFKKVDKRKDRAFVKTHKEKLIEDLENCTDYALALHYAVLIIFETATDALIHANGKQIMILLKFLKPYLDKDKWEELIEYHDYVAIFVSGKTDFFSDLPQRMARIKKIAYEYRRISIST